MEVGIHADKEYGTNKDTDNTCCLILELKKEIEDFTHQFGGTYNMDMIKGTTTHLICEKPTGKKFSTAKDWGIKCVPFQWLEDMKEKQGLVFARAFLLPKNIYSFVLNNRIIL